MKVYPFFIIVILGLSSFLFSCSTNNSQQSDTSQNESTTTSSLFEELLPIGQLSDNVTPTHYVLEMQVDPRQDTFSGTVKISVSINQSTKTIWLHGKNLMVNSVSFTSETNTVSGRYSEQDPLGVAMLSFDTPIPAGDGIIEISYEAPFNEAEPGMFISERAGERYATTQFEAIGARQVFPSFDTPRFKIPFDFTLVVPSTDIALTTTPTKSQTPTQNGWIKHVFETTRPLPTYLIAFVIGPFDVLDNGDIEANTIRDVTIPLRGIVAKGQVEQLQYALKHTSGLLEELEKYFGSPYPYKKLDLIAVPEGFSGAMENVGAITYQEYLLLMDDNSPISQRREYTITHAHELAHQWFGNLVTPSWWTDLWLNESFASWLMYKTSQAYWPEGEFNREVILSALSAMKEDSLAAARQIREPIERNDQIDGAFDGITYNKGGGVLLMLEQYVGEEAFQKGVQLHMKRFADDTATTDDFIRSLADGSNNPAIEPAFRSFIDQPGVPLLNVSLTCDKQPVMKMSQKRYQPLGSTLKDNDSLWTIPICYRYGIDKNDTDCFLLTKLEQEVKLPTQKCPAFIHPNAGGAGYYRFSLDDSSWNDLIDQLETLPASEALVLVDSISASFASGDIPANAYVKALHASLNHAAWDVASKALNELASLSKIVDAQQLIKLQQAYIKMAKPLFESMNEIEISSGKQLLYSNLQKFLIITAEEQNLRKPLADLAAQQIGFKTEVNENAVPSSLMETTLTVGVQELEDSFFDALLGAALNSADPSFRYSAITALARTKKKKQIEQLHKAILNDSFDGIQSAMIIYRQLLLADSSELTFKFVKDNDKKIISILPGFFKTGFITGFAAGFCDHKKAKEWESIILENKGDLPGYERPLALAIESIKLCSALKKAQEQNLIEAIDSSI